MNEVVLFGRLLQQVVKSMEVWGAKSTKSLVMLFCLKLNHQGKFESRLLHLRDELISQGVIDCTKATKQLWQENSSWRQLTRGHIVPEALGTAVPKGGFVSPELQECPGH